MTSNTSSDKNTEKPINGPTRITQGQVKAMKRDYEGHFIGVLRNTGLEPDGKSVHRSYDFGAGVVFTFVVRKEDTYNTKFHGTKVKLTAEEMWRLLEENGVTEIEDF